MEAEEFLDLVFAVVVNKINATCAAIVSASASATGGAFASTIRRPCRLRKCKTPRFSRGVLLC